MCRGFVVRKVLNDWYKKRMNICMVYIIVPVSCYEFFLLENLRSISTLSRLSPSLIIIFMICHFLAWFLQILYKNLGLHQVTVKVKHEEFLLQESPARTCYFNAKFDWPSAVMRDVDEGFTPAIRHHIPSVLMDPIDIMNAIWHGEFVYKPVLIYHHRVTPNLECQSWIMELNWLVLEYGVNFTCSENIFHDRYMIRNLRIQ